MAQKRALRSASRLNNVSANQLTGRTMNDTSSDSTSERSSKARRLGAASQSAPDDVVDSSLMAPAKKRKLEPRAVDLNNLTSNSVSLDRPAGSHSTNAPLKTLRGSRLVTYPQEAIDGSTSQSGVLQPMTSTSRLLEQACAHLIQADPRLQPLIEKHHCRLFSPEGLAEEVNPFQSLCSGIMAQQVSGAAAKSIKAKFIDLFRDSAKEAAQKSEPSFQSQEDASFFPSPTQVAPCEISFLRRAGLSARKAEYIKGLAEKFVGGELNAAMLIKASDDEIIEKLTAVRGLGLWSVQMFACFALKRTDIFSTGTGKAVQSTKEYSADTTFKVI